jgi:glycosyltransferase involved in cell wall biosynthesis
LRKVVREFSPDIVQANGARTVKYSAAVKALTHRPAWKLIYRNIDSPVYWSTGVAQDWVYRRWIMRQMDGVVGVSQTTLKEVKELYEMRSPAVFIPNGVNFGSLHTGNDRAGVRRRLGVPHDATVALFIGSLSAQKRPDRFLRVLSATAATVGNLYGWLLGDGPDREQLERSVVKLGLQDRVRLLGSQEHVAPFIDAADFYVSTSGTEGIPAAVLEAGYLGKPTIGMRVGGMHECVIHGETGLLVEAGNEDAMARQIVELARHPVTARRLGERAHLWSRDRFSIERVGAEYLGFYRSLTSGPAPG